MGILADAYSGDNDTGCGGIGKRKMNLSIWYFLRGELLAGIQQARGGGLGGVGMGNFFLILVLEIAI